MPNLQESNCLIYEKESDDESFIVFRLKKNNQT